MYLQSTKYCAKEKRCGYAKQGKEYREKEGLTQEELSKKSEVSRNTISAIETGTNTNVTYEVMEKIAKALNKKVATIFLINKHKILCKNELRHGTKKERK